MAGGIKSLKNPNDPIRNRTFDLPTCSKVPQPTAPLYTSIIGVIYIELLYRMVNFCVSLVTLKFY